MEMSSEIDRGAVFIAFSSPQIKDLVSFGSWQKVVLSRLAWKTQSTSFLVKSAKGGERSGAAGAGRICCACEIILLTIWSLWLRKKTAILDCSPGSHLLSHVRLKIHHRQQSGLIQYIYSGMFLNTKRLFLLPLKKPLLQRVGNPTDGGNIHEEIRWRRRAAAQPGALFSRFSGQICSCVAI